MIPQSSRLIVLCFAFLLAACSNDGGSQKSNKTQPVIATFASGSVDTVTVDVLDPEAAEQIELVAPDGKAFTAFRIDREKVTGRSGGGQPSMGVGVGVGGGSSSGVGVGTGIGIGFPLGIGGSTPDPKTRSIGQVKLADMTAYRAQWTKWQARVTFPGNRIVTVAAPPPPPAG